MANDKDFKVKNGLTVGTSATITNGDLNISNGRLNQTFNDSTNVWTSIDSGIFSYTAMENELVILNDADGVANSMAGIFFNAGQASNGARISSARIAAVREDEFDASLAFATRGDAGHLERMRITSNGNVGIGTDTPTRQLHVYREKSGAAGAGAMLTLEEDGANASASMTFVRTGIRAYAVGIDSDNIFKIASNEGLASNTILTIGSTGNLEVNGSVSDSDGNLRNVIHGSGANISTTPYTVPANSSGAFYQLIAGSGTVTFDAANFARGDIFMIYNNTTSAKTLSFGTFTLGVRLAGDTTNYSGTSSLQVQAYGIATILCPAPNLLVVSGNAG